MPPQVTVGLPVYNGERHLEGAIRSILAQSYSDFELVISDNASTDATGVICKDYALLDERIRYHRQDVNVGCRGNFHIVFGLGSGGRYFKWAGHDDRIEREYLARCVAHLEAHPEDVLCQTLLTLIDGEGNPLPDAPVPSTFDDPTPHARLRSLFEGPKTYQTLFGVWRHDALARSHLFGPWYASDRALLIEMSLFGGFAQVPEPLYVSCDHEERGDYVDDRLDWYAPERAGEPEAGYWHHLWWVTRSLATTPMSGAERLRCLAELGRRASGKTGEWLPILAREAAEVAASRARTHHTGTAETADTLDTAGAPAGSGATRDDVEDNGHVALEPGSPEATAAAATARAVPVTPPTGGAHAA
jgi:glycosyltransferase involved in cell wall biosynthesis